MTLNLTDFGVPIALPDGIPLLAEGVSPEKIVFARQIRETDMRLEVFRAAQPVLPLPGKEETIADIHRGLAENQGLIEAETGETAAGRPFLCTILKTAAREGGVRYTLTLFLEFPKGALKVCGYFLETGMTGIRDTQVLVHLLEKGEVGEGLSGWMEDPYDPDYTRGVRMNKSEQRRFDSAFPTHPLATARAWTAKFLADN